MAGLTFSIVYVILFAGIIPMSLIGATPVTSSRLWMLNWAIAVAAGAAFGVVAGRGEGRLYQLMFWLFCYLFFGLAPMVQLRRAIEPSTTPGALSRLTMETEMVIIVGMVAFALTNVSTRKRSVETDGGERQLRLNPRSVYIGAAISVMFSVYYIFSVGVDALVTSRAALVGAQVTTWPNVTNQALFIAAGTMTPFVIVAALRQLRRTHATAGNGLLMLFMTVLLLLSVNPISSPRYVFGTVGLGLIALMGGFRAGHRFRIAAALTVVAMLFIFPYADRFRLGTAPAADKGGVTSTLTSGDFDAFAQTQNTVDYTARHGFSHGKQALGVVLFWVPRGMWEGKPEDTGPMVAQDIGYHFTNLSSPLWAELWIDGGWFALIAGMAGFGWLLRRLDDTRVWLGDHAVILANVVPFYLIILLRGSLLQSVLRLAVLVATTHLVLRHRSASAGSDARVAAPGDV